LSMSAMPRLTRLVPRCAEPDDAFSTDTTTSLASS
jgi:hypothetical protein